MDEKHLTQDESRLEELQLSLLMAVVYGEMAVIALSHGLHALSRFALMKNHDPLFWSFALWVTMAFLVEFFAGFSVAGLFEYSIRGQGVPKLWKGLLKRVRIYNFYMNHLHWFLLLNPLITGLVFYTLNGWR